MYKSIYEHDAYKLDIADLIKKPSPKLKQQSKYCQRYNAIYKLFKSGNRSSEILRELDNLQDKINGDKN